ncbi:hypothetical protein Ciccas_002754, partial [Cichlidogyrus casuarinus]
MTSEVTTMEFINEFEEENSLLLTGTKNGSVRIWQDYVKNTARILTAWNAFDRMVPSKTRSSGLKHCWNAKRRQLWLAGDVHVIRLVDIQQEQNVLDLPTHEEACVSCLTRSKDGSMLLAGFGHGIVKMFDPRLPRTSCCVMQRSCSEENLWVNDVSFNANEDAVFSIDYYITESPMSQVLGIGTGGKKREVQLWSISDRGLAVRGRFRYMESFNREQISNPICMHLHPYY